MNFLKTKNCKLKTNPSFFLFNFSLKRKGFTLIELLAVVAILGILITLVTTAVQHSITNAKRQQRRTQMNALATAIVNYKHDNNRWPLEDTSIDRSKLSDYAWTNENWIVFGALMIGSAQNPTDKAYLDYNAFYVLANPDNASPGGTSKSVIKLAKYLSTSGNTLSGRAIVDFDGNPFVVQFENSMVTIRHLNWDESSSEYRYGEAVSQ